MRDCTNLGGLPPQLRVADWIEIANSGLRALPERSRGVRLLWRGVAVDADAAFHPERLRVEDILQQQNSERRRLYLQWFGVERFMRSADARVLDADTDAGSGRELLQVELANDESLVCVSVQCPSTGRRYLLRVPPTVTSCQEAVAWTAGFDDPLDYRPIVET